MRSNQVASAFQKACMYFPEILRLAGKDDGEDGFQHEGHCFESVKVYEFYKEPTTLTRRLLVF